jgi:hypothetical protein
MLKISIFFIKIYGWVGGLWYLTPLKKKYKIKEKEKKIDEKQITLIKKVGQMF